MSATMKGDVVSEVISQPAPASCIQVPMFEVTDAIQSARKIGSRNGLQADLLTVCGRRVAVVLESGCSKAMPDFIDAAPARALQSVDEL